LGDIFFINYDIHHYYYTNMSTQTGVVIFAILAAFGLVPVVAVDIVLTTQVAEAKGCPNSIAANASQGRCVNPGN
jgi:hypothetical protein